jgi:uncharacterized repeat protein (TIGR02543 family)
MAGTSGSETSAAGVGGYKIKTDWSTVIIDANGSPRPTARTTVRTYVIAPSNNYFTNYTITSSIKVGSVTLASASQQYSTSYNATLLLVESVDRDTDYASNSGGTWTKSWTVDVSVDGSGTSSVVPQNMTQSLSVPFANVYTVSYDANGGSVSTSSIRAGSGDGVTLPTPSRTGYTFNGWYSAASGGSYRGGAGSYFAVTSTQTLYAQWTISTPAPVFWDTTLGDYSYGAYNSSNRVQAYDTNSYSWTSKPSWATGGTNGYLSGTPNQSGTFYWSVTAIGDGGSTPLNGSSYVYYPIPSWSDSSMGSSLRRGTYYNDSVSATIADSSAITYSSSVVSGSLVSGLSLGTNSLSGTPTSYGSFTVRFYASNSDGGATSIDRAFTVSDYFPVWSDQTVSSGNYSVGQAYSDSVSAIDAAYYSVSGTLPPGITLNVSTGLLSGSFTASGTYVFTIRAYNNTSEYISTPTYTMTVSDIGGRVYVFNGSIWEEKDMMFYNGNWNTRGTVYYYDGSQWQKSI